MRKNRRQVKVFSILAAFLMVFSLIAPSAISAESVNSAKLSDTLVKQFENTEKVTFIVDFKDEANTAAVAEQAKEQATLAGATEEKAVLAQREAVINTLQTTADKAQSNVFEYLKDTNAEDIKSYFITNAISVTATQEVAEELLQFNEVADVYPNIEAEVIEPVKTDDNKLSEIAWNVDRVNAPQTWEKGFNGEGVVVASIDSGVQWDHPALKEKYRGYNAETGEVDHSASFFDAVYGEKEANDYQGHGTHVTGTMVGDEVGVAPQAKWIAANVANASGGLPSDAILSAAEWMMAPGGDAANAPDVVNNSWGFPGYTPEEMNEFFRDVIVAWQDAGIFPVFAAGNAVPGVVEPVEGSVSIPALYPEAFAVGATDQDNALAEFSLRGPSPYGDIKPNVAAPGVEILSTYPGDGYAVSNGTSMAAPAVAGIAALMIQAKSDVTIDELKTTLQETATELTNEEYTETPNNGFGHGLVDALAAVEALQEDEVPEPEVPTIENLEPSSDQVVKAGDDVTITFTSNIEEGNATYTVADGEAVAMNETEAGAYTAVYTVPEDAGYEEAAVEVTIANSNGDSVSKVADGKIVIEPAEEPVEPLERIYGDWRYDTAIETSQDGWEDGSVDKVILARGDDFADALAGVPLAHAMDTPILLTPSEGELSDDVLAEINRLGANEIYVLGGAGAIELPDENELTEAGKEVIRLAGDTRFETAVEIAEKLAEVTGGTENAVIANGLNFPDALTVASFAAQEGTPILLTRDSELPEATQTALNELGTTNTVVVGGKAVVSDDVLNELPAAERLSGDNRYETNIAIAEHFGVENSNLYVATGTEYADALTGSVLAAKNNSAILLVGNLVKEDGIIPNVVSNYITEQGVTDLTIFGGTVAVDEATENALSKLLK
ncbi:hypothetical protein CIL05_01195 [Virgibacillus profundi]|uniref:Peptidase S8/S53 domain-containing protein n=1 Tax=Virgibacillus profundi TaxID=2024555 RepID=A0A2A2II43_9BACI|nr:cell wall-binding repeat-containing protein [Virgibacillus profundi]PAV31297.1 hypothetical protein CIL05_01195 [Virgibacillus profundi]PXY55482.1 hypothetical protein CIT14_01200 [Virgibacillus profundi]